MYLLALQQYRLCFLCCQQSQCPCCQNMRKRLYPHMYMSSLNIETCLNLCYWCSSPFSISENLFERDTSTAPPILEVRQLFETSVLPCCPDVLVFMNFSWEDLLCAIAYEKGMQQKNAKNHRKRKPGVLMR